MIYRVVATATSDEHVRVIDSWWRRNRPSAPGLFRQEYAEALDFLSVMPGAGALYEEAPGYRRLILRGSRNHVYYRIQEELVVIEAVWSAVRGVGPDLDVSRQSDG